MIMLIYSSGKRNRKRLLQLCMLPGCESHNILRFVFQRIVIFPQSYLEFDHAIFPSRKIYVTSVVAVGSLAT